MMATCQTIVRFLKNLDCLHVRAWCIALLGKMTFFVIRNPAQLKSSANNYINFININTVNGYRTWEMCEQNLSKDLILVWS